MISIILTISGGILTLIAAFLIHKLIPGTQRGLSILTTNVVNPNEKLLEVVEEMIINLNNNGSLQQSAVLEAKMKNLQDSLNSSNTKLVKAKELRLLAESRSKGIIRLIYLLAFICMISAAILQMLNQNPPQ